MNHCRSERLFWGGENYIFVLQMASPQPIWNSGTQNVLAPAIKCVYFLPFTWPGVEEIH